jgi:hypothetical protein
MSIALEFYGGVALILVIVIVAGRHLRGAAGIVVAAVINNKRRHGLVDHVVNPGFSSGPWAERSRSRRGQLLDGPHRRGFRWTHDSLPRRGRPVRARP